MPTMSLLLYFLFAITALSVVFTIIAWFILSSIGAKISILERETEKRSLEFDTLRKEYANNPHTSTAAAVIEETDTSTQLSTISETVSAGLEDTIQIFRNVRSSYKEPENKNSAPQNENMATSEAEFQSINTVSVEQTSEHEDATIEQASQSQSAIYQDNLSAIIPEEPIPSVQTISAAPPSPPLPHPPAVQQEIIVRLYSEATKDADFQTLWKNISIILQQQPQSKISIDLSEINFLYEKEMDYLVKINYLITRQGGSLSLIHCEKDLTSLINRKEHLGSIIKS